MAERKCLTEKNDFRDVYNALYVANTKWWKIGLQLGIQNTKLTQIKSKVGNDDDEGLKEVVSIWLKSTSLNPTWHSIIDTLKHPTVGEGALAAEIEEKYVTMQNTTSQHTTPQNPPMSSHQASDQTENGCRPPPQKRPKVDGELCPNHPDKSLRLFCESCQTVICDDCTSCNHKNHPYDPVADTLQRYTQELKDKLESAEEQLKTVDEAVAALMTQRKQIEEQEETIEGEIHVQFNLLRKALDNREKQLIQQMKDTVQKQMATLDTQTEEVTNIHDKIRDWTEEVSAGLTETSQEVLVMRKLKIQQKQEIDGNLRLVNLDPREKATLELVVDDLEQQCHRYGMLMNKDQSVDPTRCYVTEEAAVTLQTLDKQGKTVAVPTAKISAELVQSGKDTPVHCEVTMKAEGKYRVTYKPDFRGTQQLHIKVGKTAIATSPIPVTVRMPLQKLGESVRCIRNTKPESIAMNHKGQLLVAEYASQTHQITVITLGPDHYKHIPTESPISVCSDDDNNIFVASLLKETIFKLSPEGELLKSAESKCNLGVIVFNTNNGRLYVSDRKNDVVHIFEKNLIHYKSFPCNGQRTRSAAHLAVDSKGYVYVASYNNKDSIQVYTAEGKLKRALELKVTRPQQNPLRSKDIHIDRNDTLYVLTEINRSSTVAVFTSKGQFVESITLQGMHSASGLTMDEAGHIIVHDYTQILMF